MRLAGRCFVARKHSAGEVLHLDAPNRLELDAAAPELALHLEVCSHAPACAFTHGGQDGRVMHDLFGQEAEAPPHVHVLVRLTQQRVEGLACAAAGARIPAADGAQDEFVCAKLWAVIE